ncbi:hypothetical protein ACFFKU_10705 [Kineococcus gynurae]|uniref:Uncharacterized protein n=2 Tax=Kineococcus gynurae TaxID=452979 RepID=A0ABV5LUS7_9ACTN
MNTPASWATTRRRPSWLPAAPEDDPFDPGAPWRPVTRAELVAAAADVRDGLLRRVLGPVVVSRGSPDSLGVRAAAARLCLPPGAVLLGDGARWVREGGAPPTRLEVSGARIAPRDRGIPVRVRPLPPQAEVVVVAGLRLLAAPPSPVRPPGPAQVR